MKSRPPYYIINTGICKILSSGLKRGQTKNIQEATQMKVLVINCGSSSLKYQLIDMDGEKVLCKGLCERIGMEAA